MAVTITFDLSSEQAAELLGKLAYDNAFREQLKDVSVASNLLAGYGISISEEELAVGLALPPKRQLQDLARAIHYPAEPTPLVWAFGFCIAWAITSFCAGATDPTEPSQQE